MILCCVIMLVVAAAVLRIDGRVIHTLPLFAVVMIVAALLIILLLQFRLILSGDVL